MLPVSILLVICSPLSTTVGILFGSNDDYWQMLLIISLMFVYVTVSCEQRPT